MNIKAKIFVRSLPGSERRQHMEKEMQKLGWDFEFWDNTHYESDEFDSFVRQGNVKLSKNYMKKIYDAENVDTPRSDANILFPSQVANHISMRNLFYHIAKSDYNEELIFVMEDDLMIKNYAESVLEGILPKIKNELFICGIGWGLSKRKFLEHRDFECERYRLNNSTFRFSNPFFVTNKKTAMYICENLIESHIDLPCDVWLHRYTAIIDKNIKRYIIYPALAKDLSFSGHFDSDILPKKSRISMISSKKVLSVEDEKKLSDLRNEYDSRFENCKTFWRKKYGM